MTVASWGFKEKLKGNEKLFQVVSCMKIIVGKGNIRVKADGRGMPRNSRH